MRLTEDAADILATYDWPGNIRELQNVIERAVILSQSGPLRIDLVLGNSASTPGAAISHFQTNISGRALYYRSKKSTGESTRIYSLLSKKLGEGFMVLVAPLKF